MSHIAPKAFRHCGYRVTELFCEPDGTFPNRSPNPAEYSNLGALQQAVREEGAGFGVAFDGDGDRVVFCDEKGQVIKNERALALFARQLLKDAPAPVVYDQKSSSVVQREILKMGHALPGAAATPSSNAALISALWRGRSAISFRETAMTIPVRRPLHGGDPGHPGTPLERGAA